MKKEVHVVGAVITDKDRILCAQRGETKTLAYKWEFPGGKIESGETQQEALKREIFEEMECEIEVYDHIADCSYEYDFAVVHLSTYYCKLMNGTPNTNEHIKLEWRTKDELAELEWAAADLPTIEVLTNAS
ncbi:(deoxy)nucleoside triphosphate pyrophosphohydrolase [Salsuginibacillus kocurii]|uniref:(deoxy)nucleoside triphosphate pyrophosphohydrolase n=1 Tax=Salsuginibacillus kocurii TaxID=427078 RepID=UPI00037D311F|nr:(deoxy)nucleoside triphosphate pyrophosphohydrolase [Salsuginibacillus kocurii]